MEMQDNTKSVLLISMPFACTTIPSIQLPILEGYLKEHNITVETHHLYLKAAEFYELKNYQLLIYPPNEPYTAKNVFSKYILPDHWEKTTKKFQIYFNEKISSVANNQKIFSFEDYVQRTDNFYYWVIKNVDWRSYDIIGFTLNYGQLLPSLAVAKKIKELWPEKKIIFGGSRTVGDLGIGVMKAFPYIDFIVSGDGENALYQLAANYGDYQSIPGLIYRRGNEVIWNKSDNHIDLNSLPIPSYDHFYHELNLAPNEIKQDFNSFGRLPIEISRGCWWNQCSFCSQKILHKEYREKKVEKIVEEILFLSDKYKILDFQLIGDTLPKKDYRHLFEEIIKLGRDFTFFVEARAGQLKSEDYVLMKKAGFTTVQLGIETFSQNYLRKINKGVRVIDNIAALKFCKENEINVQYNLLVNFPNEEPVDFEETKKNIQDIQHYINPPHLSYLIVEFGSSLYTNPELFNIEKLEYTTVDQIMYPQEFLEKNFACIYNYKRKQEFNKHNWEQLIEEWRKLREQLQLKAMKNQAAIDKYVFYFVDGGHFIKIYDKRFSENVQIYILNEIERAVFLACINVISYQELQEQFLDLPDFQLATILETLEHHRIIFKEKNLYFSLPLCYSLISAPTIKREAVQPIYP